MSADHTGEPRMTVTVDVCLLGATSWFFGGGWAGAGVLAAGFLLHVSVIPGAHGLLSGLERDVAQSSSARILLFLLSPGGGSLCCQFPSSPR